MILTFTEYYKALIIKADPFESLILDEMNFSTFKEANQFISSAPDGCIAMIIKM